MLDSSSSKILFPQVYPRSKELAVYEYYKRPSGTKYRVLGEEEVKESGVGSGTPGSDV